MQSICTVNPDRQGRFHSRSIETGSRIACMGIQHCCLSNPIGITTEYIRVSLLKGNTASLVPRSLIYIIDCFQHYYVHVKQWKSATGLL